MLVEKSPAMEWASDDVAEIRPVKGNFGQPEVLLSLSGQTAKRFADLTRANLNRVKERQGYGNIGLALKEKPRHSIEIMDSPSLSTVESKRTYSLIASRIS